MLGSSPLGTFLSINSLVTKWSKWVWLHVGWWSLHTPCILSWSPPPDVHSYVLQESGAGSPAAGAGRVEQRGDGLPGGGQGPARHGRGGDQRPLLQVQVGAEIKTKSSGRKEEFLQIGKWAVQNQNCIWESESQVARAVRVVSVRGPGPGAWHHRVGQGPALQRWLHGKVHSVNMEHRIQTIVYSLTFSHYQMRSISPRTNT